MIEFGMADGMVRVVVNQQLESRISPAVMEQVRNAEQGIIAGTIAVP
jgi:basic membrane lipoprotein Med (substrate-binding protein (PBP1-ABC) superfamily)